MGQTLSDKVQAVTLEQIVFNPKTVNNYKDNTILSPNELAQGDNIIFDDGVIEKVLGTTIGNSDSPGNNPVYGLHRAYAKDGTRVALRLSNGTLKSGPAAFATTVLSSLATAKRTPFINVNGKAYGINETDGIIRYDPKKATGILTGVVGPYLRKKISFFEADETWTTAGGASASVSTYRVDEFSGNSMQSLKIPVAASSSASSYRTVSLNLNVFDNSKVSDGNDLICLRSLHDIRNYVDKIVIQFSTGDATFTNYYQTELKQADFEEGDFEWSDWEVKKSAFTNGGTPTGWDNVNAIGITATANANVPVGQYLNIYCDYMFLKAGKPEAKELKRKIANCDSTESWAIVPPGATGAVTIVSNPYYEGYSSLRLGTGATDANGVIPSVDLSVWPDGTASQTSDEIVFRIQTSAKVLITNTDPLVLELGTSNGIYWEKTWATLAALGVTGDGAWYEVRVRKSAFSAVGGIAAWTGIDHIGFRTSALGAGYMYIDDVHMEQLAETVMIADMESDETWVFSTDGGGNALGKQITDTIRTGLVEGSQCLKIWGQTVVGTSYPQSSAWYTFGADKKLTEWADASGSSTDDYISFYLFHGAYNLIEWVEIWFDNNSTTTFADAYYYRVPKEDFEQGDKAWDKNYKGKEIKIQKKNFSEKVTTPGAGGWDQIRSIKFIVSCKTTAGYVTIDNVVLKRKVGVEGRYYYKYAFVMANGGGEIQSALSEQSEHVDVKGSFVSLTNVSTSQDSRVTARKIYRLGGSYANTWMLVKTIADNTTTTVVDDKFDEDLKLSLGEDVPVGNINSVLGNNLAYDPESDRILYWGDPTYRNRVYYSHPTYYNIVDEAGYREFEDEVMGVVPWYGQNVIFFKNRIKKVMGDLPTGDLSDIPSNVGSCTYWAFAKWKQAIPFVGWDNVYLFDGYKAEPIGDDIKGYFKGREAYLTDVSVTVHKDCLYVTCMDKTGTPTYNTIVLRCYLPTKSWTVHPNWNVKTWSLWDQGADSNEIYYGDSITGNIYSLNSSTFRFNATAITSTILTGWFSFPDAEIALHHIELKAKGTAASSLTINGYKNFGSSSCSGTITLTTNWVTYTIGPKNIWNLLRGDHIKIQFAHATDNAYFKMKDVVFYFEKLSKRIAYSEVTIT